MFKFRSISTVLKDLRVIMGWCNASNCTLSTKKDMRLFHFPRNQDRRSKWLINCLPEI